MSTTVRAGRARAQVVPCRPSSRRPHVAAQSTTGDVPTLIPAELQNIQGCTVTSVLSNTPAEFGTLWSPVPGKLTLLVFFTHWADLGSWELAQRLVTKLPELQAAGVEMVAVGLGSAAAGRTFAEKTGFPADRLYADEVSACHRSLGFSPGFLGGSDLNGYLKIFPMLAGIGSPGTMQEVLRGYVGDRNGKPLFEETTPLGRAFGVLGTGYQRPFELATQRLFNMAGSLSNWSELAPKDTQQLVQQGGSFLVKGSDVIFSHRDTGILITTDVDELMAAVRVAAV